MSGRGDGRALSRFALEGAAFFWLTRWLSCLFPCPAPALVVLCPFAGAALRATTDRDLPAMSGRASASRRAGVPS